MQRLQIRPRQLKKAEATSLAMKVTDRLKVVDPMTNRALPADGAAVGPSSYWAKRLHCGDVEEVKKSPRAPAKSRATSKGE